jgi:hypothetical protein
MTMTLWVCFCVALGQSTAASKAANFTDATSADFLLPGDGALSCPRTSEEGDVYNYVQHRNSRYKNGTIAEQIKKGTYTIDSLQNDIYEWHVNRQLWDQSLAISQLHDLVSKAKMVADAKKSTWLALVKDWIGQIIAKLAADITDNPEMKDIVSNLVAGLNALMSKASDCTGQFLEAAMQWRADLPSQNTKSLLWVDNFINGIRNKPALLLKGYDTVTKLISSTTSMRHSLNNYYIGFANDTLSAFPQTLYAMQQVGAGGVVGQPVHPQFPIVPQGLDACTVAKFFWKTNSKCLDAKSVWDLHVTVPVVAENVHTPKGVLVYSCSDLSHFKNCYYGNLFLSSSDARCQKLKNEPHFNMAGFPNTQDRSYCANGFTSSIKALWVYSSSSSGSPPLSAQQCSL